MSGGGWCEVSSEGQFIEKAFRLIRQDIPLKFFLVFDFADYKKYRVIEIDALGLLLA